MSERRFAFVQWELPGRVGPDPGRYPVRLFAGDDVRQIVVIDGIEAPRRPSRVRRRRPRAKPAERTGPAPVEVTRATVIDATAPLHSREAAEAWLERASGAEGDEIVADALALLRRTMAAHRVAAADPYVPDPNPERALVTRVGYGSGEQVAEGDWEAARVLPPPPQPRSRAISPQHRLAALLSGRDVALACEELALRVRADLAAGRSREAALVALPALDAALAELESWRGRGDTARRLDELATHRPAVAEAAAAALQGGLSPEQTGAIDAALGRLEAALRARAVTEGSS